MLTQSFISECDGETQAQLVWWSGFVIQASSHLSISHLDGEFLWVNVHVYPVIVDPIRSHTVKVSWNTFILLE